VTYIISEPCIDIKDKSCVDVCPVDCIHEFERMLIIDPEECIDCGACEPECPVVAKSALFERTRELIDGLLASVE
jgi:ferredoxin